MNKSIGHGRVGMLHCDTQLSTQLISMMRRLKPNFTFSVLHYLVREPST